MNTKPQTKCCRVPFSELEILSHKSVDDEIRGKIVRDYLKKNWPDEFPGSMLDYNIEVETDIVMLSWVISVTPKSGIWLSEPSLMEKVGLKLAELFPLPPPYIDNSEECKETHAWEHKGMTKKCIVCGCTEINSEV